MGRKAGSGSGRTRHRPGLPKPESVTGARSFTSPAGTAYRILSTNERDAYENAERAQGGATMSRQAAKTKAAPGKSKKPKTAKKKTAVRKAKKAVRRKKRVAPLLDRPTRLAAKRPLPDSDSDDGPFRL